MDSSEFVQKYSSYLRQYWIPLALCVVGLIFLGYGMIGFLGQKKDKPDILFEAASDAQPGASIVKQDTPKKMIAVDVEGAVVKPGVYKLAMDSRIQDALIAAGGLGEGADRERLAKSLNLAAKLIDGGKVYIPSVGEEIVASGGNNVLGSGTESLININSASESELDTLPGIGKTTADKIISNRPYGVIEELVEKKIVGNKVFQDIKGKIGV
jgi:competence protein ComEA